MKKTVLVGLISVSIGVLVGNQLPRGLVTAPVSVTTFKIKVPFEQWVKGFDSKNANKMHRENNINPIFRGISNNAPNQVIVIHQSNPGSVERLLSDNRKMIESLGHIIRTTRTTNWKYE